MLAQDAQTPASNAPESTSTTLTASVTTQGLFRPPSPSSLTLEVTPSLRTETATTPPSEESPDVREQGHLENTSVFS